MCLNVEEAFRVSVFPRARGQRSSVSVGSCFLTTSGHNRTPRKKRTDQTTAPAGYHAYFVRSRYSPSSDYVHSGGKSISFRTNSTYANYTRYALTRDQTGSSPHRDETAFRGLFRLSWNQFNYTSNFVEYGKRTVLCFDVRKTITSDD